MITAKKAYELALKNNETYLREELEAFYTCIKHEAKNGVYTLEIGFDDTCTLTYSDIVWIAKEFYLLMISFYHLRARMDTQVHARNAICTTGRMDLVETKIWLREMMQHLLFKTC